MAKRNNPKREARIQKNNRNLNWALSLFTAGFIAEFYLLIVNNYYVKGTATQLLAAYDFLRVMSYIGCALIVAGVVFLAMRKKWPRFAKWIRWLLGLGVFLTLSSLVMIKIYPAGTTFMCVAVPVLMLLSVVFFLYQREFFVEAVALTVTLVLVTLLNRSISTALFEKLVQVGAYGSMLVFAAAFAVLLMVKKNNGRLGKTELFPAKTDYTLLCAVMIFCIAVIAVSLFTAWGYYMVWASAVVLFGLAVWYTVKML